MKGRIFKILLSLLILIPLPLAFSDTITLRSDGKDSSDPAQWTWNGSELGDQSDSTYASASSQNRILRSSIQNHNLSSVTINSVEVWIRAGQTTGNEYVDFGIYCNGTDYYTGTNSQPPQNSFSNYSNTWTTNPCTNSSWTLQDIDSLVVAVKTIANGKWNGQINLSEVWVVVNYTDNRLIVGTNSATVNGDYQITASASFTGDGNNNSSTTFERCLDSTCSSPITACNGVTGVSPRTCVMTGLQPGTNYWIRITHNDADGVVGTNPQIIGPYTTTHNSLTVGTSSATVNSDTQITVFAAFTGDNNSNSSTTFERCSESSCSSPLTACSGVTGASPRECVVSGLQQNTQYWFRITHTDADGINGTNPHIIGPYTTFNRRVIPDPGSATVDSYSQITVYAPFGGDSNSNSSTNFERCTDSLCSSPLLICSGITGGSPRTCVDNGLNQDTDYWYRITFSDPDGVNTSNAPNPQIIGPYHTPVFDNIPPVFAGIKFVQDTGEGGKIRIEFNSASDPTPPIKYNIYYNLATLWNDSNWNLNQKILNAPTQPGDIYELKTFLSGLQDGEEYVVGVRAQDGAGNEEANSVTLTVIPYMRKMNFTGYNLISDGKYPLSPNNTPIKIFGDDVGGRLSIYIWQSAGLGFNPPFNGSYIIPSTIEAGKSYWIYNWVAGNIIDDDFNSDNSNAQTAVNLSPGWNMISNPYPKNILLRDVIVYKANNPGKGDYTFEQAVLNGWLVNSIYWWNGSGYEWRAYNDTPPAMLTPWRGYWIYQSSDTVILQLKFNKP